jgi:hypothetical protein
MGEARLVQVLIQFLNGALPPLSPSQVLSQISLLIVYGMNLFLFYTLHQTEIVSYNNWG